MKKQLFAILTALCVWVTLMTTAALAADEESGYTQQATTAVKTVGTAEELHNAVKADGTVKLTADITIDKTLSITKENTLDLNGHVLKYESSDKGSVIRVESGGILTLEDSDQTTEHIFDKSRYPWVLAADDAEGDNITVVKGGVITGGMGSLYSEHKSSFYTFYKYAGGGVCVAAGGTFTMNSGSIIGCYPFDPGIPSFSTGMGGGIYIYKGGTATMNGGMIAGCKATNESDSGGGVRNDGTFTMRGTARIEYCMGDSEPGAIYNVGTITIEGDVEIRNCISDYYGDFLTSTLLEFDGNATIKGGTFYGKVNLRNTVVTGGVFYGDVWSDNYSLTKSTVTFKVPEGVTEPQSQTIFGTTTKAIKPADPTEREGYEFGWYLDGTKYEFDTPVTEDITLVGEWNRICHVCNTTCPEDCEICGDGVAEVYNPIYGADIKSGDVFRVSWKLCKKIVGDDAAYVKISLVDTDGGETVLKDNFSIDSGELNCKFDDPERLKGGTYKFRITVMRQDGETEVRHFDTLVFINGGNAIACDKTIDYADDLTFDVKELFKFYESCDISTVKFTIDGGTGEGTLDGTTLNIRRPGTFRIKATFTADEFSGTIAGDVISTLTVNGCTVTFDSDGGSAVESRSMPVGGKVAEPTAPTRERYIFDGWYLGDTKYDFETPVTTDITLTAKWIRDTSYDFIIRSYSIIAETTDNGDVTPDTDTALFGTTVALTVTPDDGYVLETLTVTDSRGNELELTDEGDGKYSFVMPMSDVTVSATFMEDNTMLNYFVDVSEGDYYYDAVLWAAREGITSGTDDVHFSPDMPCTRAQIVTFLWRAAGSPVVNYAMNFVDVPEDAYYAEAVRWALSEGITAGTSETTFSPDDICTRAQAVVFLFRYAAPDAVTLQELVSGYADADSVPEYAMSAMNWALYAGIVQGDGENLMPDGTCTRAQIVTFLYRALAE